MNKDASKYISFLWEDLPEDKKDRQLEAITTKLKRKRITLPKITRPINKYQPYEELVEFWEEMELIFGANLDDDWFRLCATHTFETFVFYSRERYAAEWTTKFSNNFKATSIMSKWPGSVVGLTNPWKHPCLDEVRLCKFSRYEEIDQYKVEMLFAPGVTRTFWFKPDFKDSSMGDGWVTPCEVSKTVPMLKI